MRSYWIPEAIEKNSRSLRIVFGEPVGQFLVDVAALFGEARKMRRAGIGDHADGFAALPEQYKKFAALKRRYPDISFAVQDEQRSCDLIRVHDGGKLQHRCGIFFLKTSVVIHLPDVAGGNEAEPVRDAGAFDGGFVAMRLRDRP